MQRVVPNNGTVLRHAANGDLLTYTTLAAAKNDAASGDLIEVFGGTFNERNLLKNGVNWLFHGTVINYTGTDGWGIFDDSVDHGANEAVVCSIMGTGTFKHNQTPFGSAAQQAAVFHLSNAGTSLTVECNDVGPNIFCAVFLYGGAIDLTCRRIYANAINHGTAFYAWQNATVTIDAAYIEGGYIGNVASNGCDVRVRARDMVATADCILNLVGTSTMHVIADTITATAQVTGQCQPILVEGGSVTLDVRTISNAGGTVLVTGAGGNVRVSNCRLISTYANSPVLDCRAVGGTTLLENVSLIPHSGAAAASTSLATSTVKVIGQCYSTKVMDETLSQTVGSFAVADIA